MIKDKLLGTLFCLLVAAPLSAQMREDRADSDHVLKDIDSGRARMDFEAAEGRRSGEALDLDERDATNSRVNRRDEGRNTILPEHQSNTQAHLNTTASIRKALMRRDELSVLAKNIKIVTLDNGSVVLRGPVRTSTEKQIIESLARQESKGASVVSYLDVEQ